MAKSTKKGTKSQADASADPREALGAFLRRLRRPRIAQVAAEMVAWVQQIGGAAARAAEELGVLETAARFKLVELVEALLAAGVDPNVAPANATGSSRELRALAAAVSELSETDDATVRRIVEALLAAGAAVDTQYPGPNVQLVNGRRKTALDVAVDNRCKVGIELLAAKASAQTKTDALCNFLARIDLTPRTAEWDRWLDELLQIAPVDGTGHDGITALHVAAVRGDVDVFSRLQSAAQDKLPRLREAVSWTLENATPPGGGTSPTIPFPAGATPLYAARATRTKYEQIAALYDKPGVDEGSRKFYSQFYARLVAGHAAIIALLESQGAVDDTQASALPPPLAKVLAACASLADHLGLASFAKDAALIDPANTGPFGFFLECIKLLRPSLDDAARARLETQLVGKFVTGSIERNVLVGNEQDPLERDFGPDPKQFRVRVDEYPASARPLLKNAKHFGVHGNAVLSLESSTGVTKLWEIGPEQVVDHGELTDWLVRGVAELTAR